MVKLFISYFSLITLKHLAVFKVLECIAFCIFKRHSLALFSPNSSFILFRTSSEYPPNTWTVMLICLTMYPWYLSFISHLSVAYFVVFSVSFFPLFPIHGHVISMHNTSFSFLSAIRTSTRFDLKTVLYYYNYYYYYYYYYYRSQIRREKGIQALFPG